MVNVKGNYYRTQLNAVLTSGVWASSAPSKSPNGVPLSWNELLRKFRKHCPQEQELAEVASHTQAISVWLLRDAGKTSTDLDDDYLDSTKPLKLHNQCTLQKEKRKAARDSLNLLEGSEKRSDRVLLLCAHFAYAIGEIPRCLSHLSGIPFSEVEVFSALPSKPPSLLVPSATTASHTGSAAPSLNSLNPQLKGGETWILTERIKGLCLQGMCHEKSDPPDFHNALLSYRTAISLVSAIQIQLPAPTTAAPDSKPTNVSSTTSFTSLREFWRWAERALFRSIAISSQTQPIHEVLNLLRQYLNYSSYWATSFRPVHRSVVLSIYLHCLIALADPAHASEAQDVVKEYRCLLSATTKFPRAGHRNERVEDYVDLCVAIWDVHGSRDDQAHWVVEILWWATNYTFNSPRLYRHLTRLLCANGEYELAKRSLGVYVEVVSKARQSGDTVNQETDTQWIETLVSGARMLCRLPDGCLEDIKTSLMYVEKARDAVKPDDVEHLAAIDLAEAVAKSVFPYREENPATRLDHFSASLNLLERSISLHESPSTNYHLALALSRATPSRDLPRATRHAQAAVEQDPEEIRAWHLLALLLMSSNEWKKALKVVENAIALFDAQMSRSFQSDTDDIHGAETEEQMAETIPAEAAIPFDSNERQSDNRESLLSPDTYNLPPGDSLLLPWRDHPPPSTKEQFERMLQLRLTLLILIEHAEGPENASKKWLEVFAWFGGSTGIEIVLGAEDRATKRQSDAVSTMDIPLPLSHPTGGRPTSPSDNVTEQDATYHTFSHPHSVPTHTGEEGLGDHDQSLGSSPVEVAVPVFAPTAIRITPATPMDEVDAEVMARVSAETRDEEEDGMIVVRRVGSGVNVDGIPTVVIGSVPRKSSKEKNSIERHREKEKEKDLDHPHKGKKVAQVQQMLKSQVHKGAASFKTVSRVITRGRVRPRVQSVGERGGSGVGFYRSNSAPDFHAVLAHTGPYQASSIHSRSRISSWGFALNPHRSTAHEERGGTIKGGYDSPTATTMTLSRGPATPVLSAFGRSGASSGGSEGVPPPRVRTEWERRLLSDLWTRAAGMFRRGGKIDDCRNAVQEAELLDRENAEVWVQYGLYLSAIGGYSPSHISSSMSTNSDSGKRKRGGENAVEEAFHKALFIDPESVSAAVHLCAYVLSLPFPIAGSSSGMGGSSATIATMNRDETTADGIDMAIGLLTNATLYGGWDVAEVWYLLGRASQMQGRIERERECLEKALSLVESRSVRDARESVGICL